MRSPFHAAGITARVWTHQFHIHLDVHGVEFDDVDRWPASPLATLAASVQVTGSHGTNGEWCHCLCSCIHISDEGALASLKLS